MAIPDVSTKTHASPSVKPYRSHIVYRAPGQPSSCFETVERGEFAIPLGPFRTFAEHLGKYKMIFANSISTESGLDGAGSLALGECMTFIGRIQGRTYLLEYHLLVTPVTMLTLPDRQIATGSHHHGWAKRSAICRTKQPDSAEFTLYCQGGCPSAGSERLVRLLKASRASSDSRKPCAGGP